LAYIHISATRFQKGITSESDCKVVYWESGFTSFTHRQQC